MDVDHTIPKMDTVTTTPSKIALRSRQVTQGVILHVLVHAVCQSWRVSEV